MKTKPLFTALVVWLNAFVSLNFSSPAQAQPLNLTLQPYGPYESTVKLTANQSFELNQLQTKGFSTEFITSRKEEFKVKNDVGSLKTWQDWTNYYQADTLKVPVTFDVRDPVTMDFGDPISAFHSYQRANYIGDHATILKFSDAAEVKRLKNIYESLPAQKNISDTTLTPMTGTLATTHTMILLTAKTALDHKEYVLVFWLMENSTDPTNGSMIFQQTIFVRLKDTWLLTRDLIGSPFGRILFYAHVNHSDSFGRYAQIHEKLKDSSLPQSFYTIQ